jgi:hypothetical protein
VNGAGEKKKREREKGLACREQSPVLSRTRGRREEEQAKSESCEPVKRNSSSGNIFHFSFLFHFKKTTTKNKKLISLKSRKILNNNEGTTPVKLN